MAAIDKLYADWQESRELFFWAARNSLAILNAMECPRIGCGRRPIAQLTPRQDRILLWRCPLPFVREYLAEQCGMKTRWYHKIFWKR